MKRSGRIQRTKPLVAGTKPRRAGRSGPRPTVADTDARATFKVTVCADPCIGVAISGHVCEPPLQAMHVVPKQTLKRRGLRHLLWDPLNGVSGCYRIHRRHDLAVEKIPRELLPQRCIDFALEHNLVDVLDRHWPETGRVAA